MDAKFFQSLFEGDSSNGTKLGMGLTGGDFWARPCGCLSLYRGTRWWDIDFRTLVAVGDLNVGGVVSRAAHLAGQTYFYVVRTVNRCGQENMSVSKIARAVFDAAGDLQPAAGRNLLALCVRRIAQSEVRLTWLYSPYHGPVSCAGFEVCSDSGGGTIDFQDPITRVVCLGAGVYSYEHPVQPGRYRFCVQCRSQAGAVCGPGGFAAIEVPRAEPAEVCQLHARVI